MLQSNEEISQLITKYLDDSLNEAEASRLSAWLAESSEHRKFFETATNEEVISRGLASMMEFDEEAGWEMISRKVQITPVRRIRWNRYLSVAAVIMALIAGTYLYFFSFPFVQKPQKLVAVQKVADDKEPGKDGAVLILATGEKISLDSIHDGNISSQEGATLVKRGASLVWEKTASKLKTAPLMNTIVTSRGRQFQMTLSDGTKVWLNSASSMRFPVNFTGDERVVEISGEAYFEVAKKSNMPFRVKVGGMEVQVLGTHFNIKAFDDEERISTTLLEGKVNVKGPRGSLTLSPGEQANLARKNNMLSMEREVDVEKIIAWKTGFFEFDDTGLQDIMRQISRWYDVDVVYESEPTHEKFGGGISKQLPLKQVLHMLEMNGVKFRLEEDTLYVKP